MESSAIEMFEQVMSMATRKQRTSSAGIISRRRLEKDAG